MRKHVGLDSGEIVPAKDEPWADINNLASVEVTSEDVGHPIEDALVGSKGWRALHSGTQTIRLIFDEPRRIKRIHLVFEEKENPRTQEIVVRWSPDSYHSFREIVRQQWNFSSGGSVREVEDYRVELRDVKIIEMTIVPDIAGGTARASLNTLRIA